MPSNLVSQIHRMVAAGLNAANDVLPGQSVASGTGAAQYLGEVGARVALSPLDIRFVSATGTLFGGIYQYVITASGAAAAPARGTIAFRDLSVAESLYQVTSDAKPTAAIPTLIAGIFLNAVTKGNYGWIQLSGRASVLFDSAITAAAAGNPVTAKISAAVASTADVGAVDTLLSPVTLLGVAETLPVLSTISVVQLLTSFAFNRV
jgi:hypothetical protein